MYPIFFKIVQFYVDKTESLSTFSQNHCFVANFVDKALVDDSTKHPHPPEVHRVCHWPKPMFRLRGTSFPCCGRTSRWAGQTSWWAASSGHRQTGWPWGQDPGQKVVAPWACPPPLPADKKNIKKIEDACRFLNIIIKNAFFPTTIQLISILQIILN